MQAQTPVFSDTLSKEKQLTEIVVTAQRTATNRFSTPEAISVLSASKMQQGQASTAPEALTSTAGVFVQKTNHGGGSPFLRGLTGNQTLQLFDSNLSFVVLCLTTSFRAWEIK